jgi:hypothetical protein
LYLHHTPTIWTCAGDERLASSASGMASFASDLTRDCRYRVTMAADRFILDPSIRALLRDLGIPAGRVLRRAQLPAGLLRGGPVALAADEYFRF